MKIVVDGMGGDHAPCEIVKGCVQSLELSSDLKIFITGDKDRIEKELGKYEFDKERVVVIPTTEIITNNEHPVSALRKKRDSSLYKALKMVKDNEADAIVSAGSTGAFLAGCTLVVGRIRGIKRPALAPVMPSKSGPFMVVDVGANADCKPINLVQFAEMGSVYFESILNINKPKVGLVNIGSEEEKGNELTKETFQLLKETDLNFIGNVEPREIPKGETQVLVCDGFTGNVVLKLYEGVAQNIFDVLKEGMMANIRTKLGALLLKPVFKKFKKDFDYKEYGGAAFLGVDGICIKAHGSSDAKAFKNAIRQSISFYDNNIIDKIKSCMESKDN